MRLLLTLVLAQLKRRRHNLDVRLLPSQVQDKLSCSPTKFGVRVGSWRTMQLS